VNQCRFNSRFHLLATSGIEKILKIWSPYSLPGSTGGGLFDTRGELAHSREPIEDISPDLVTIRNRDATNATESVEEDRMVIAYFDGQVKRAMQRKENESGKKSSDKIAKIRRASFGEAGKLTSESSDGSISLNESHTDDDDESSDSVREKGARKPHKNAAVTEYGSTPSMSSSSDQSDIENCDKQRTSRRKSTHSIRNKLRNL
jgi:hypothetical protein